MLEGRWFLLVLHQEDHFEHQYSQTYSDTFPSQSLQEEESYSKVVQVFPEFEEQQQVQEQEPEQVQAQAQESVIEFRQKPGTEDQLKY